MYRKFRADEIFTGREMLGKEAVLITESDGTVVDLVLDTHIDDVEYIEGILSPGLVNAHCHLELSHLKGRIPKHTGLVDFVQKVMKIRGEDDRVKQEAMKAAQQEMLEGGVVAVGDICNSSDSIAVKHDSLLMWRNFVEVSGFTDTTSRKRLNEAEAVKAKFGKAFIVPHSPYSVSHSLFKMIGGLKEPYVSIHNQESWEEDKLYKNFSGDFFKVI